MQGSLAKTGDAAQKTLAYAILPQQVRNPRAQQAVSDTVQPVLTAGWADAANAPNLARAVRIMKLQAQYAEPLKGVPNFQAPFTNLFINPSHVRRFQHLGQCKQLGEHRCNASGREPSELPARRGRTDRDRQCVGRLRAKRNRYVEGRDEWYRD